MNDRPFVWMDSSAEDIFRPQIEHFVEILLETFLPFFNDLETAQQRISDEVFNAIGNRPTFDSSDEEAAYERIDTRLLEFTDMRSVYLTTCVSGLFHLFERQLIRHLAHEFRGYKLTDAKDRPYPIDQWAQVRTVRHAWCFYRIQP